MALYAIGDTHLSLTTGKSMEVFGGNWKGYVEKLEKGFQVVQPEDTVVLAGDLSWGLSLQEAEQDFAFLNALPGTKVLLKGNHDYWWETAKKMTAFFVAHHFDTFRLLHNNCCLYGETALCGTRGWFVDEERAGHNVKMLNREVIRLETSLKAAGDREKIVFLHYPPIYQGYRCEELLALLKRYGVKRCYYGHLHSQSCRLAVQGEREGTEFSLISADYLNFMPKKILN